MLKDSKLSSGIKEENM